MLIRAAIVSCAFLVAVPAFAADGSAPAAAAAATTAKPANAQQNRMADCNQQATGKKGDERKAFMSSCLKGEAAAPAAAAPLEPKAAMSACNKAAAEQKLAGDSRKTYMSACLKAKGPALMPK